MSSAYKLLPYYTYNDYCQWEGHWELIGGIPYAMSPQPRPEHQAIAGNLHSELRSALKRNGCDCKVYQPVDYKISDDTILNPDILISYKPITKAYLDFAPELVAEILSPATQMKDRHTKFELYQQQKIPYYIIVDIDKKAVEVYQLAEGRYTRKDLSQEKMFSFSLPECQFDLDFSLIWE